MELNYLVVDVFSSTKLKGNPVMVVVAEKPVSAERMQALASWNGMPETVFMTRGNGEGGADYSVVIYSPKRELPFAGHPSLGAAHAAIELGWINVPFSGTEEKTVRIVQSCKRGHVDIQASNVQGGNQVSVKTPSAGYFEKLPKDAAVSVGLAIGSDCAFDCYLVNAGANWIIAKLRSQCDLEDLIPEMREIEHVSDKYSASGITVYAPVEDPQKARLEVRSFGPSIGVPEDAVCGGGNACVAVLEHYLSHESFKGYKALQGRFVGRAGVVHLSGPVEDNRFWVGGNTTTVLRGTVTF